MPVRKYLPILAVSAATFLFTVLLLLVRAQWAPLESVDHGLANDLNQVVANHSPLVTIIKQVTWFGSNGVLWAVVIASIVILSARRLFRLAAYLAITGAGALALDPILKSLIGRVRPVVPDPVAYGTGNSFPSGHALGSIVCYGAVALVFLPGIPQRFRTAFRVVIAALIIAIGCSRLLLGVHYLSDVIGAWSLGVAWLGLTAYAFEVLAHGSDRPVREGLDPSEATDLEPAQAEQRTTARHPARDGAGVAIAWVLIVGVITGIGALIVRSGNGNILGDETIPHQLAAHRTPSLTRWSAVFSTLGATQAVLIVSIATAAVALAVLRRWRPVVFVAVVMIGELVAFLGASAVVRRPRPDVPQLDPHLPTFAYPSGHIAATACIYTAIAVLVFGHTRAWWRWLFVIPAVVMPVLVTVSRLYRGEHHPTDVLGSLVFVALWIPVATRLIRPAVDRGEARVPAAVLQETS